MNERRAQLVGGCVVISAVMLSGVASIHLLSNKLEEAHEAARVRAGTRWIHDILSAAGLDAQTHDLTIENPERAPGGEPVVIATIKQGGNHGVRAARVVEGRGYNGDIVLALAIDERATVVGINVISHRETLGFGDFLDHGEPLWTHSFIGRSLTDPEPGAWQLRVNGGAIDGVSGATITANAVVVAVCNGLHALQRSAKLAPQ